MASRWEYLAGFVSAVLVLGLIGFLLYQSRSHGRGPPSVEVVVDTTSEVSSGHFVGFTATNRSRTTASALMITGELLQGDVSIESSSVTLDYLPPGGSREGGLFFSNDPAEYTLEVAADGYVAP